MMGIVFATFCLCIIILDRYKIIDLCDKYIAYSLFSLPVIWNYVVPLIIFKFCYKSKSILPNNIMLIIITVLYVFFILYVFLSINIKPLKYNKKETQDYKEKEITILRKYLYMLIAVVYIPLIILLISSIKKVINLNIFFIIFCIISNVEIITVSLNVIIRKKTKLD